MKYSIPLHIFFHYTRIWKKISVGGLNTSLFCAIIPTLFPYFFPFWYPYILLHFEMFFITCGKKESNCNLYMYTKDDNGGCLSKGKLVSSVYHVATINLLFELILTAT